MKKHFAFFLPFALLLLIPLISAQTPGAADQPKDDQLKEPQLKLIPEPKEVHLQQGGFRVRPTTRILVEFGHQEEDRIAAETLAEEIHDIKINQVELVICELANMICGALLSASDKNGLFHLGVPQMQPALEPPKDCASIVTFELETGTLTVQVEFGC